MRKRRARERKRERESTHGDGRWDYIGRKGPGYKRLLKPNKGT
jgi:hypothetical protein